MSQTMKIKPPALIAGISALLFLAANLMYVAARIWLHYGFPLDAWLAGWIISFVFEMPAIIILAFLFRKKVFIFLSLAAFALGQIISTIVFAMAYEYSLVTVLKSLTNWPYLNFGSDQPFIWNIANLTLFLSTALFIVAFVLALISKDSTISVNQDLNFIQSTVPPLAHVSPPLNQKNPIHDPYVQIEKLGELKEKGLITKEEFDIKKKQILDL